MKTIYIFLFLPFSLLAQVSFDVTYDEVTEGANSAQGKFATVSSTIVIEKEGTAEELYTSTKNWLNEYYKSAEDVIKGDIENKYIKINGFVSSLLSQNVIGTMFYYDVRYTIEFRFKENKFKVDIINLEQYFEATQYTSGGWSNTGMRYKIEKKNGKPDTNGERNLNSVTAHFNALVNSLNDYSISTVGGDDFDF